MTTLLQETTEINILPAGYTARAGKLEDYKIAFNLFNADSLHRTGAVNDTDPELLLNEWKQPNFDMEKSVRLVFAPDGSLAGYIAVWDTSNPPVHPGIWASIHPEHYETGIDNYMYAWAETRAAQSIARVPEGLRFALRTSFSLPNKRRQALVEMRGWTYIHSFYRMETIFAGLPEVPPSPNGIVIRRYNPESEFEAVVQTLIDSFRDHYGFVAHPFEDELDNFRHNFLGDPLYDPHLWFVAMDGDQMAGICICRPEDYENPELGCVNELGVRRAWRKRGLGTILLKTAFAEFYRRGKKGAELGVDATSLTGALRLYERAGMHVARQFDQFEKEFRPGEEISTQNL
jgi:mycothiol synthase